MLPEKKQTSNIQHRMKHLSRPAPVIGLVVGALFAGLATAALAAPIPVEIRAVLKAQADAWNRGDIDGYMKGYARGNSTQFLSGDTLTSGWKTVRDRYAKKYDSREKMGTLSFSEVQVTALNAEAALVIGRWKLVRKADKPHGRFTLLFRRTPEGWRIMHDHTSGAEG